MKKRKDGRYQKRVTLPGGKSKLLYGKTQKEVMSKADRLKLDYALGKDLASGNFTLSEWLGTWWSSLGKGRIKRWSIGSRGYYANTRWRR